MTSPVQMDINDSISTMSFVMPSEYTKENLPKTNDPNPNVQIKNTADEYVAVKRFCGYASYKDLKFYSKKLQNLLKEIITFGNYRFIGYKPPFQFIGRRNEIIEAIDWKGK